MLELRRPHAAVTPRAVLLLTLPPLMWAGNAVVGRLAVGVVPPLALNFVRWVLAFIILLPLALRSLRGVDLLPLLRTHWRYLALAGLLGMGCYNALQYLALHTSPPLNVTLIAAGSPIAMMVVGAMGYGVRPRGGQWLGALLSLCGVAVVIGRGHPGNVLQLHFVVGDLLMLVAVFTWAGYSWLLTRPPLALGWSAFLLVQMAFGIVWSFAAAGAEAALASDQWHWNAWVPLLLLYVALCPSLIAYRCWGLAVATVGPATAAFFANLTPVFAALMSAALLGERAEAYHAVAFVLIAAGIVVAARR